MDPRSPTSPMSVLSPNSSEHSLTPTSPQQHKSKSIWGTSAIPVSHTPAIRPNTSIVSPFHSRASLRRETSSNSPKDAVQQRMDIRNTKFPSLTTKPRSPGEIDQDGDLLMSSPSVDSSCQTVWDDSTTSPILGKLIGITVRTKFDAPMDLEGICVERRDAISEQGGLASGYLHSNHSHDTTGKHSMRAQQTSTLSTSPGFHCSQVTKNVSSSCTASGQIDEARKRHLENCIHHLGIPLVPLISVSTGLSHPEFPRSILQYHLLTHDQLDSLARWYHQTIDNRRERFQYPAVIQRPWTWSSEQLQREIREYELSEGLEPSELDLSIKRRRFGKFIGLRGCDSPVSVDDEASERDAGEEALDDRMEREWRDALRRAREENEMEDKMWRGRF